MFAAFCMEPTVNTTSFELLNTLQWLQSLLALLMLTGFLLFVVAPYICIHIWNTTTNTHLIFLVYFNQVYFLLYISMILRWHNQML